MRIKHAVLAVLAMVLAIPASADNTQGITDTTIKIGNLGPFSGPQSTFTPLNYGPEAYLRYINDQGGVNGHKFVTVFADDSSQRGQGHRRGEEADLRRQGFHDHVQPLQRRRHGDQADAGARRCAVDRCLGQSENQPPDIAWYLSCDLHRH